MHTLPYQSTQPYETALNFLNKPSFSGPLLVLSWESRMWLLVLELPFTNSETLGKPLYIYRWFSELAKEFVWVFIKCYGKIWMNFLANWRFFSSVKWGSWLTPGSLPCLPCTEQHLNQSAPAVACINHLLVLGYCLSLPQNCELLEAGTVLFTTRSCWAPDLTHSGSTKSSLLQ